MVAVVFGLESCAQGFLYRGVEGTKNIIRGYRNAGESYSPIRDAEAIQNQIHSIPASLLTSLPASLIAFAFQYRSRFTSCFASRFDSSFAFHFASRFASGNTLRKIEDYDPKIQS